MVTPAQIEKAHVLRDLHREGVLVLPNAWDAGSAAVIAGAGARAIATTSGGVAWSLGRPDGGTGLTRTEVADHARRIADAVAVPVTVDIEGGYGPSPADVADTVDAVNAPSLSMHSKHARPGRCEIDCVEPASSQPDQFE